MAIDTKNKRASASSFLVGTCLPVPDGAAFVEADRAQIAWCYFGIDFYPLAISSNVRSFEVKFYDQYGNLKQVFNNLANIDWEWNRVGGCGQAVLEVFQSYDYMQETMRPKSSVKIFINNELRYTGKLIKIMRSAYAGKESVLLTFYGYLTDLSFLTVRTSYESMEVSDIVKDILDNYVLPYSQITYDTADIDMTDYVVQSVNFNHSVMDAIRLLSDIAGNVEWGVDRNKKFFFKATSPVVKKVYIIGKDIVKYQEERDDESVVNILDVFGADGYMTTLSAALSVNTYGTKMDRLFETSISEASDGNRYGSVILKKRSSAKRRIKFSFVTADEFVEQTLPLGARAINAGTFRGLKKYGHYIKYGTSNKYGSLKRDQLGNIRYTMIGDGLLIDATMTDDIPNMGDLQKQIEYEIKNLQRR